MSYFSVLFEEDIRNIFQPVVKFVVSRKMFPAEAQSDLSEYFQGWGALFQRICEIKKNEVLLHERLKAASHVFRMLDLSGRMVVKKSSPFSAFDFKGDEAAYDRVRQFVVNIESEQVFTEMWMSSMARAEN